MKKNLLAVFFTVTLCSGAAIAQRGGGGTADTANRRTGGFAGAATPRAAPRPYKSVITDKAITRNGLFKTHKIDDKYYFEIPDSLLGREILVVSRISKAGAEMRVADGYAGDQIGSTVISFEKGPLSRIFMRKISYATYSPDSTKSMYQAVKRSNIQAIAAAFNIAAYSPDSKGSVVDMTDYINGDNDILFFSSAQGKSRVRLGAYLTDRSYIESVKTFPTNIEIKTIKTYNLSAATTGFGARGGGGTPAPTGTGQPNPNLPSETVELNTSLVILPKVPMQARFYDERIGYFTTGYTDFDANPQGVKAIELIARWRLEPKAEDMAKYKRGELVIPKKQIIYYIDPATPKKWVPYLIAGVNDWQKAFEKAGFKEAIVAKMAPTPAQDSTWSLDDAAHSAIVYKPSETENASGPHISDPRSGEILETHINWFHNVMKLVHDWYMIQTAAVDPRARTMHFSDELMGDLIRFVSSHEVGHTLGLRHNWGSSSTTPVENLRNKAWVEANGHTPSIMDYARFNYVAQPEDNISKAGLYPRIGDYDKWAIEWGYKVLPNSPSPEAEKAILNKISVERLKDRHLWFGTESNPDDPHSQNEDLSDNAMKASTYGIKNLKVILAKLPEWTKEPNDGYDDLEGMYGQLTTQFGRYMGHVTKNIAGVYENPKTVEQVGKVYENVPAATQKEAMAFLDTQLFTTPTWLLNDYILSNTQGNGLLIVSGLQNTTLTRLLSNHTLYKLISAEAEDGARAYKISDFFTDINNSIFREVKANQAVDVYRRNLQKLYVEKLITLVKPTPPVDPAVAALAAGRRGGGAPRDADKESTDVVSVAKAQLKAINAMIKNSSITDSMTTYHLQDLSDRINDALNPKG
ncbi:zinc-dependent metalloprotease [Mucilaginibacter sp. HMF5004]|uniref:zinc-dependent metalloprotease n=1 Tax=Mucilaginibacter rivuli TaxID=2857527 RepID=UPI001C5EE0C6|nr:zinc-dependent metalloprotease [Mucilaginibacter rivuli]MBW4889363.1 zinc-dependent metalloprotease [Mucilaginibacter rivuli]